VRSVELCVCLKELDYGCVLLLEYQYCRSDSFSKHAYTSTLTSPSGLSMANLRTLDLSWNKFGNAGTIAFADAIKSTAENPIGSLP
jgi:hypothetical protein